MQEKTRNTFRRFISLLLVLCMTAALAPLQAGAAEVPEGKAAYIIDHRTNRISYYNSFDDAWSSTVGMNDFTIGLLQDLHLYKLWSMGLNRNYVLELNGHKLFKENNKEHSDGALIDLTSGTLKIYGGRQNWTLSGDTVTFPETPEDKIPGTYYDSTGLAQTSGTPSSNSVWHLCYYDMKDKKVKFFNNDSRFNVSGGLLTGGWTGNGGAIQMTGSGVALDLYDVTLSGNIADDNGGAVAMLSNYQKLTMTDSRLAFNQAEDDDGGGLFIKGDYCKVYMTRSHVDYNIANDNGGGIALTGTNAVIAGDANRLDPSDSNHPWGWGDNSYLNQPYNYLNGEQNPFWSKTDDQFSRHVSTFGRTSTLAYNILPNADTDGGGSAIYVDGKKASVGGLNIMKNVVFGGSFSGRGAVHFNTEENTLANSNVWRNWSRSEGGGVFVDNDQCALTDVTVTDNYSETNGWSGGGVYVLGTVNLALSGKCIIKDNSSAEKQRDDLYLGYYNTMYARLYPSLTRGSEVWLWMSGAGTTITKIAGNYDDRMFFADDVRWHVEYKDQVLKLVDEESNYDYRSRAYPPVQENTLVPEYPITDGSRTKRLDIDYISEQNHHYPVYQGVVEFPAFLDTSRDLSSTFFYSDGYFDRDPRNYDSHLATASMHLALASFYSNDGNQDGVLYQSEGSTGGTFYPVKSNNIRQFLSDIGVKEEDIFLNDYNIQKPGSDTIGVAIGSKDITLGDQTKKLVIVGVRGAGYEQEWISNMTMGSYGEAKGFASAADQVFSELTKYLQRKGIDGSSRDTIFWVAGYSRAGATSNLTGRRIVDQYDTNGTHTFVYTFEAPQGGESSVRTNGSWYYCIHNVINDTDLVPQVGPSLMGFHRYGVDHYVPGNPNAGDPETASAGYSILSKDGSKVEHWGYDTFKDNKSYSVGSTDYNSQKEKMLSQLKTVAGYDMVFSDYFHAATISFVGNTVFSGFGWQMIDEDSGMKTHIPSDKRNAAAFIPYFLEDFQKKSLNYMVDKDGKALNALYRNVYSQSTLKNIPFESAAANAAGVVFGMTAEEMEGFGRVASTLLDRIDKTGLYTKFLLKSSSFKAYAVAVGAGATGGATGGSFIPVVGTVAGASVGAIGSAAVLGIYNLFAGSKSIAQITDEIWGALSKPTEEQLKDPKVRDKYMEDRAKGYLFLEDVWSDTGKIETLKTSIPALTFVILDYLKDDYDATGNDMLGTMVYNVQRILSNHYPEVNLAWLRSYDSYYNDQTAMMTMAGSAKVTSVAAPLVNGSAEYVYSNIISQSDPVVTLAVPGDVDRGAGIFFRFTDKNYPDNNWHPYSGPITLPVKEGEARTVYYFETYAIHDGIRSGTNQFSIILEANNQFLYTYPGILFDTTGRIAIEQGKEYSFEAPVFEKQAFKNWTWVEGNEDGLDGLDLKSRTNTFTVKTLGGYAVKANYFDKSNQVALTMAPIVSGEKLPTTATLTGVTTVNGRTVEKNVSVQVAWTRMTNDGWYYAMFYLPEDPDNELSFIGQESGWLFKSYDSKLEAVVSQAADNGEGVTVIVDGDAFGSVNADGSAQVRQSVRLTGYVDPADLRMVTVKALDMNRNYAAVDFADVEGDDASTLSFLALPGDDISIPIPSVLGEEYVGFLEPQGLDDYNITEKDGVLRFRMPNQDVTLPLTYRPVVQGLTVVLSGAPQAGEMLPGYIGCTASIENLWAITDGVDFQWLVKDVPVDLNTVDTASYGTAYTLRLTMDESRLKGGMVQNPLEAESWSDCQEGIEEQELTGWFAIAEDMVLRAVDQDGNPIAASSTIVSKPDQNSTLIVDITFKSTAKNKVSSVPDPMTQYLNADGTPADINGPALQSSARLMEVRSGFTYEGPDTVSVIMEDGTMEEVSVTWGTPDLLEGDGIGTVTGTLSSEEYDLDGNTTVTQTLVILEDEDAQTDVPAACLMLNGAETDAGAESETVRLEGSFSARVALSAEDGAAIYYTTDGTEPTTSSNRYTEPFEVGWGDSTDASSATKEVIVKAIAVETGKQPSNEVCFAYSLEKGSSAPDNGGGSNGGSSGGGGGGAAAPANTVIVPSTSTHGRTSSSAASAKAGDKVTITVTPDEGYAVSAVTVTDAMGNAVPVTKNADGTYSFTMPDSMVSVNPVFVKEGEHPDSGDVSDRFTDVDRDAWYHDAVQWAVDRGIMNGVSEDTFAPNDNTTRAMVVTMLWRLAGEPAGNTAAPFTDVKAGSWYADAVNWAAESGAVKGTSETTFSPDTPVTREQLATILYRYAQAQGKGFTGAWAFPLDFSDAASVSEWADEAMHWMTMNGIINGMGDGTLAPQANATRAQIATMFMRFADVTEQ